MCLIRKEGYGFGAVKDKPIEAYKVLMEQDGVLYSPVMGFRYEIGKTYGEMLGGITSMTINSYPVYDFGFHMLSSIDSATQYLNNIEKSIGFYNYVTNRMAPTFLVIVKCSIPPTTDGIDTIYVTGEDGDYGIQGIVSNRIKIVEIVSKTPIESRRNAPNLKPF